MRLLNKAYDGKIAVLNVIEEWEKYVGGKSENELFKMIRRYCYLSKIQWVEVPQDFFSVKSPMPSSVKMSCLKMIRRYLYLSKI